MPILKILLVPAMMKAVRPQISSDSTICSSTGAVSASMYWPTKYADSAEITISTSSERPPRVPLASRNERASSGSAGAELGFRYDMMTTNTTYVPANRKPGTMAPRYMSPMERPNWSARMISTSDGGMICDSVPDAAMMPLASLRS
ncbi:hypothetical protein D3C71_1562820 [compost metagenome]